VGGETEWGESGALFILAFNVGRKMKNTPNTVNIANSELSVREKQTDIRL
jgi:hypothetical protein